MGIQWSLVVFTALTGVGAGMFFFMALDEIRGRECKAPWLLWVVIILLAVGGIVSMTHLPHPERAFRIVNYPTGSIFIEAGLTGITIALAFVYWVLISKTRDRKSAKRTLAILGMVSAALLAFMSGHSYMMESRPAWNTLLLPLGYWATAFSGGSALYQLCIIFDEKVDESPLAKGAVSYTLCMSIIAFIVDFVYMCGIGVIGNGSVGVAAWCLVLLPSAVAIICAAIVRKQPYNLKSLSVIAFAAALLASFGIRILMWLVIDFDVVTMFPIN